MIEFINNNALFLVIFMILFFMNKSFYSRISFNLDIIEYKSTRERLQITRAKNIFNHMNKTLIFAREALTKLRKQIISQTNKYKKKINYEIKLKIFLNERNIVTVRLFKKLNNKMLKSFKVTDFISFFYKLKLLKIMRIQDVFHSDLL